MSTWTEQQATNLHASLCTNAEHPRSMHHHTGDGNAIGAHMIACPGGPDFPCQLCDAQAPRYASALGIADDWWRRLDDAARIQVAQQLNPPILQTPIPADPRSIPCTVCHAEAGEPCTCLAERKPMPDGRHHPRRVKDAAPFDVDAVVRYFDQQLVPRIRQAIRDADTKHGTRRRPLGTDPGEARLTIDMPRLRIANDEADTTTTGAPWMHLAGEEYAEAYTAHTPADTVAEAIQTVQVLLCMVADIETRPEVNA